jgi:UDP-N-acetyl-D-galactosamine dehydrogenase
MTSISNCKISIIGLGYVGLPLAVGFGQKFETIGYDYNQQRIAELIQGFDRTREVDKNELAMASQLRFTSDESDLDAANIFIVTVPTPIDAEKQPDLGPLLSASETVGRHLHKNDIVVYESTVYPGVTEEVCVPVLERVSGLKFNEDFFAGYSPERINPGDKTHRLEDIVKVTSGSTPAIADMVDELYASIITAGTFKATSIKVAEAAKVIENTQRDVNIALINELALLFDKIGIETSEVLEAAGTKWNFLPFKPGLVGGHCIGVDPYYLTYKAQQLGYQPEIILSGRRINDGMGFFVANRILERLNAKGINPSNSRVLVLGITFKENCPDTRNSRVVDIIDVLKEKVADIDVYDPVADRVITAEEYGIELVTEPEPDSYDVLVLTVAHNEFINKKPDELMAYCKKNSVVFDVKGILPSSYADDRL